ncbi:MAG: universal stress protein [Gammaproteobacteria bacterium]|nr:universal stress protein [Gammaproteobacteria bacterium]
MIPNIQTILYTTDLEEHARSVLRYAASIAEKYDAQIVLLNVIEPLTPTTRSLINNVLPEGKAEAIREEGVRRLHKKIEERLRDFCKSELGADPETCVVVSDTRVIEGYPASVILQQAEETNADLIVMGTHGRTGASKMLLGSIAQKVLHQAAIPVLLVPLEN